MFEQLKLKIQSMLDTLTDVQETYSYEESTFRGDPVITLTASDNESDYRSTVENRRVYAFIARCWVNRTNRGDAEAEQVIEKLVDNVLDLFDKYYTLSNSIGNTLTVPNGYYIIRVEAAPSAWFYVDRGDSFRMAEITIRVHVDVDVSLIS